MGCGKPSRIVPTTATAAAAAATSSSSQKPKSPPPDAAVPRPATSPPPQKNKRNSTTSNSSSSPRAAIPDNVVAIKKESAQSPTQPRPPSDMGSPTARARVGGGSRRGSARSSRGNGSPEPSSPRDIRVQKRKSRATGGAGGLKSASPAVVAGARMGSNGVYRGTLKPPTLRNERLKEKDINSRNGSGHAGDSSVHSSMSAGSSKLLIPKRNVTRKVSNPVSDGGGGGSGREVPQVLLAQLSGAVVVVEDPEVEGKTRIPRPRQTHQLVDPRRYIRLVYSYEELGKAANGRGRAVSAVELGQPRKGHTGSPAVKTGVAHQGKYQDPKAHTFQGRQRPKSMMLLGSAEVPVGNWARRG